MTQGCDSSASRRPSSHQDGSATAEIAVALPGLVVVLVLALWGVGTVGDQLRCVDAARVAARGIARGDAESSALLAAHQTAPRSADIRVFRSEGMVSVSVRAAARTPGLFGHVLPALPVHATAVAQEETDDASGYVG